MIHNDGETVTVFGLRYIQHICFAAKRSAVFSVSSFCGRKSYELLSCYKCGGGNTCAYIITMRMYPQLIY